MHLQKVVDLAVTGVLLGAWQASAATVTASSPFWKYGPIEIRPHLTYDGSYNDGLLTKPGAQRNSYIDRLAPGFTVKHATALSLDYVPTFVWYSNPAFRDTLNHTVIGTAMLPFRQISVNLRQSYAYTSDVLGETGRQTDTETVNTDVAAAYVLSPRLSLFGGGQQSLTFVTSAPDFNQWSAAGGVRIALTSRTAGSIGVQSGYAAVYKSPDMAFVQPKADVSWSPSQKVTLSGGLALDSRVVLARKWQWMENMLFNGSARFEPFASTRVNGTASRTIAPSMFNGQTVDSTAATISGEQRLLGRLWVSGMFGYTYSNYQTTGRSEATRRRDNIWTYEAGASTTFLRRGAIKVSYRETDNVSNLREFAHTNRRIGVNVSYRY